MSELEKNIENVTFVASLTTFNEALEKWRKEQIKAYPKQKNRIDTCCVGIQYFIRSQQCVDAKMILSGDIASFPIEMPEVIDLKTN